MLILVIYLFMYGTLCFMGHVETKSTTWIPIVIKYLFVLKSVLEIRKTSSFDCIW